MANTAENIDIEKAKKTAEHVFGMLGGAMVSAMIYLGDRMGLYQALSGAGAITSAELAGAGTARCSASPVSTSAGCANGWRGKPPPA